MHNKHEEIKKIQKHFLKRKKKLLKSSLISLSISLVGLAIVGTKLFYPFHMMIGLAVYVLSFFPLARRIYLARDTWRKYHAYTFSKKFFHKEWARLVAVILFIIASAVFLWLRPLDEKPFKDFTDTQMHQYVVDDLYQSVTAMDYLETTGNTLLTTLTYEEGNANTAEAITLAFEEFLRAVSFSESLTETHRYFGSIPYRLWDERVSSFLISYSLYAKKYEIVHRIMNAVANSEYKKKILNQYSSYAQRDFVYSEIVSRFYAPKTRLRLSGGYFYMSLFTRRDAEQGGEYELLRSKSAESYTYLRKNFLTTITRTGEMLLDTTEQKMFDTWFPIQKTVANTMGHAIFTTRGKEGLLTREDSLQMEKSMLPGDVMLQRRNWHLSNVGIPGFWTHAALYTGSLSTMDTYFASEFPYEGFSSFSEYLQGKYPSVYTQYTEADTYSDFVSVVEAIEPGVVLQTLPKSTNADYVVVLRPTLTKKDVFQALLKTFDHVGKPYDYNFDFDTRDALVCSELLYDAYFERLPEKQGLHFDTSIVNGRRIVSPYDIASKFVAEHGTETAEFSFVYFLKSNEETKATSLGTEGEFKDSLTWSKFTFLLKDSE